jgi:hypothetical protein
VGAGEQAKQKDKTMKTEYIVTQEGSIVRRTTDEQELQITDAVITKLGTKAKRGAYSVFEVDNYNCHICLSGNGAYITLQLQSLSFTSPFRMVGEVMVPSFTNKEDPILSLGWAPVGENAKDLRLILLICCNSANEFVQANLFAYDKKGTAYRLPLPNVHDDCRLCLGHYLATGATLAETVHRCLRQLAASQWNTDLLKSLELSQKMFRWQPKNEQFEVLPPDEHWTRLCEKVSTAMMEFVML